LKPVETGVARSAPQAQKIVLVPCGCRARRLASLHRDYKFGLFWVNGGACDYRGRPHPLGVRPCRHHGSGKGVPAGRARSRLRRRCADLLRVRRMGHLQSLGRTLNDPSRPFREQLLAAFIVSSRSRAWSTGMSETIQLGTRWRARRATREPSDFESGGRGFESLRARQ
jgi:hypothetical protein